MHKNSIFHYLYNIATHGVRNFLFKGTCVLLLYSYSYFLIINFLYTIIYLYRRYINKAYNTDVIKTAIIVLRNINQTLVYNVITMQLNINMPQKIYLFDHNNNIISQRQQMINYCIIKQFYNVYHLMSLCYKNYIKY